MLQDFGIIIACCKHDYLFAKGCVASIRYFMGDVPIALIVDGKFSTAALENAYNVQIINQDTVRSDFLRTRSFGFGLTKMVAFWESPWENFLYLDADTVVWGNILKHANFNDFDFITDSVRNELSDQHISNYFFDTQRINHFFPTFRWQNYRTHYFCTGAFFAKRGVFTIEEYAEILDLVEQDPTLFFIGEQGFLNLMICRAADEGKIRLGQAPLQFLVPDHSLEDAEQAFPTDVTGPVYQGEDIVIHWCGRNKPVSLAPAAYAKPMTFNRQQFIQDAFQLQRTRMKMMMKVEDLQYYARAYRNRIRRKLTGVFAQG